MNFQNPNFQKAIKNVQKESKNPEYKKIADKVIEKYGYLFHPDNLDNLTADEFKSFLNFKNNQHWTGIHRHSGALTEDMDKLREALSILLNEEKPLEERLNIIRPRKGEAFIKGLARSVLTPILFIVYPEKYGVLNNVVEQGMRFIDFYPDLPKNAGFAEEYIEVNKILQKVSQEYSLHLWFVDWVWWKVQEPCIDPGGDTNTASTESEAIFGLERYLHQFLIDNWDNIDLSNEWNLLEKDGDIISSEYRTEAGRIDILAKNKNDTEWLVIELKRDQAVDATVGQVLRYMGWVKQKLAEKNDKVRGLIIARESDATFSYALSLTENIDFKIYRVQFELIDNINIKKKE